VTTQSQRDPSGRPDQGPRSWDTYRAPRRFQAFFVTVGLLFIIPGAVGTALRIFPPRSDGPALVASFIGYAVLAYGVASLCFVIAFLRARSRRLLGVATLVTIGLLATHAVWLAPLFIPDQRPAASTGFTLLSLNLKAGMGDLDQLVTQAAQADVVVLVESTPDALLALKQYDWDQRFPYSIGDIDQLVTNSTVFSRYPLSHTASLPNSSFQQWITSVEVPELGAVRLMAVHPCNPYCGDNLWASEHDSLADIAQPNLGGPLIMVGDFNAVDDHGPMRRLKQMGLESVTDILGKGWLPTYPANTAMPPLLAIDHILINSQLTATSLEAFKVANTDHLGLIARIVGVW